MMQFAQLSILVFGCIAAASAAPHFLISLSSASLQEQGNNVDGNPASSLAVTPSGTGQKSTLQDTQKLQSTHGEKEAEFLKVVDAIMEAVKLHANGNGQQSNGTELSQGTEIIEITKSVNSDSTNIANENATDTDAKALLRKSLQFNGSKVEQTPRETPLESDFDQIIQEINTIKKENEKVTEILENKVKQNEVTKEINEVISKPFQEVKNVAIFPTKEGDVEIVTGVPSPREDAQVNLEVEKIMVQQSEFAVEEAVTKIPLVEDQFIVTPISEDKSVNLAQTTEIKTKKTKETTLVESSITLLDGQKDVKENVSVKHVPLEDSFVSDTTKKSSHVPSEAEGSSDVLTDAESTFKNEDKSVVAVEVTNQILNDSISDIFQSASQVFDNAFAVPQRPGTIKKELKAEEPTAKHEATEPSDIFTTTVKAAKVKVDTVHIKDIFTTPVKSTKDPSLDISLPTTATKAAEPTNTQTTTQAEISTTTSTVTPQVIKIAKGPTDTFTTTGQGINKPSFQEVTTQKGIGFTSSPFKEPTTDTTARQNTIKLSKPSHKPFSSTGTGKSFTSNLIEDHNEVASSHISNHFGFKNPSSMNTISHKTFMFHGVPTDPKTLVPPQYRDFIYYNDAPEVTAAKIAFFRFQASLTPIRL